MMVVSLTLVVLKAPASVQYPGDCWHQTHFAGIPSSSTLLATPDVPSIEVLYTCCGRRCASHSALLWNTLNGKVMYPKVLHRATATFMYTRTRARSSVHNGGAQHLDAVHIMCWPQLQGPVQ